MPNTLSDAGTCRVMDPPACGTLVLTGYGLRLFVERAHLIAEDGIGAARRRYRIPRVGTGLQRVVLTGHGGTVTLDALQWIADVRAAFVHLNADGALVTVGAAPPLNDVLLRRRQALATDNAVGLALAKRLIRGKLEGQARVVRHLPHGNAIAHALDALRPMLDAANSLERVRYLEARAAAAYWSAWEQVPLQFPTRDAARVPAHWLRVGPRRSAISQGPIKATTPAHAILNYCYAVVEAEATLALRAVGCDPALGVLHADTPRRASLACDLMEPVRPLADAFVLRLLRERVFLTRDFFERRDGNCRLMPTVAQALASTGHEWADRLAPLAEELATLLRETTPRPIQDGGDPPLPEWVPRLIRTPLTGQNRSSRRFRPTASLRAPTPAILPLERRCRDCGLDMGQRERALCDDCLRHERKRASVRGSETRRAMATASREEGFTKSAETRRKMATRTREENARRQRWEEANGGRPNPGKFRQEFGARLRVIPIEALMKATGFTRSNCRAIREQRSIPHPMHWDAVRHLVVLFEAAHAPSERFDQQAPDMSRWRNELAPYLAEISAGEIARVTGLSLSYSRRVLHGHHVPHPKHWPALLRARVAVSKVRHRKRG